MQDKPLCIPRSSTFVANPLITPEGFTYISFNIGPQISAAPTRAKQVVPGTWGIDLEYRFFPQRAGRADGAILVIHPSIARKVVLSIDSKNEIIQLILGKHACLHLPRSSTTPQSRFTVPHILCRMLERDSGDCSNAIASKCGTRKIPPQTATVD